MYGVTGNDSLVFPAKLVLYSFLICYLSMKNNALEVKKTSNLLTYELL